MEYKYKKNSDIDAYGDKDNVIHFKFGDCRKMYNFTPDFENKYPEFAREYKRYFMQEPSIFKTPMQIVDFVESANLPVRFYSNYVDEEFEDFNATRDWINNEQ